MAPPTQDPVFPGVLFPAAIPMSIFGSLLIGITVPAREKDEPAMTLNPYIVLGSAVVGLLVGLTGAGGGALMTPMLILLFNVKPSTAISSDLVAAVVMRPVGSVVHMRKGTVNYGLVGWMCLGSVPMAFLGAYLLHLFGGGTAQQTNVETLLGAALLVGTAGMLLRSWLDRRRGQRLTLAIGAVRNHASHNR